MSDFDWKAMVKTVAPGLATALGGPLAGVAITAIGKALGLDAATEETVKTVLAGATPADMLKLKQAELDFQGHMRELDIDLEKVGQEDRASARVAFGAQQNVFWLAVLILSGFGAVVAAVLFGCYLLLTRGLQGIDAGLLAAISTFVGMLVGHLANNAGQVVNCYYGTMAPQDQAKADAMASAVTNLGAAIGKIR